MLYWVGCRKDIKTAKVRGTSDILRAGFNQVSRGGEEEGLQKAGSQQDGETLIYKEHTEKVISRTVRPTHERYSEGRILRKVQQEDFSTSKCSRFWTVFRAAIQSSISFLLSAHKMSFLHGVMT